MESVTTVNNPSRLKERRHGGFANGLLVKATVYEYRLSRKIVQYQQLKKKSAATALNTLVASAHIQMT
jgi:hypothetical protein